MSLVRLFLSAITDDRVHLRIVSMYIAFVLTYYTALIGSYFLLPEEMLRGKHPIINRIAFSNDPCVLALQIFAYNLIPSFLVMGASLIAQQSRFYKEKFIPISYTAFFGLTLLFGIITGTWSFDIVATPPPLGSRIIRLLDIVHHSGLIEFSGYLFLAVTSFRFTLWYSDGRRIILTKSWREVEIPAPEKLLLVLGFALLSLAAWVESRSILQLTG